MFIETHEDNNTNLAFIKSANVRAFPCSRRRSSELIDGSDTYHIPFDPEARLNTEANNRKHSSLNGFTQTYLKSWNEDDDNLLVMSLAGYLFTIDLSDFADTDTFGQRVINTFVEAAQKAEDSVAEANATSAEYIYANILLEDVYLYTGVQTYYTSILRNQSEAVIAPKDALDLLRSDKTLSTNFNDFYFSGLSFSTTPLAGAYEENYQVKTWDIVPHTTTRMAGDTSQEITQTLASLCLLRKHAGKWEIHQPALLPKIEHGETSDSVNMGELEANSIVSPMLNADRAYITNLDVYQNLKTHTLIDAQEIKAEEIHTTKLDITDTLQADLEQIVNGRYYKVPVISIAETDGGFYQLQISRVNTKSKLT